MMGGTCWDQEKKVISESAQRNLKKTCKVCNRDIPESGSLILIIQLLWILREVIVNICLFFSIDIVINFTFSSNFSKVWSASFSFLCYREKWGQRIMKYKSCLILISLLRSIEMDQHSIKGTLSNIPRRWTVTKWVSSYPCQSWDINEKNKTIQRKLTEWYMRMQNWNLDLPPFWKAKIIYLTEKRSTLLT